MHPLLRFVALLHKKVLKAHLVSTNPSPVGLERISALAPLSTALLSSFEDLATGLYAPQDSALIVTRSRELSEVATRIKLLLLPDDLADQVDALSLDESAAKTKKWYALCFTQIEDAVKKIVT